MTLPTLVLLGAEDRMGSPTVAAGRWTAGLAKAGNSRSTVTTIPGMGHAATIGAGHAQGGAVMPEYTRAVATFLATVR
jgi:pimeloyl-ACP methyl ester carboxylesterase